MAKGLDDIVALPDPVGAEIETKTRPNGLVISRVRVPIGIIGVIYEARPNVTADAGALCIKSGNVVVLRGGSDSFHSSRAIVELLRRALEGRRPARGLRAARADHRPRRRRRDAARHRLARPDRAARRALADRPRHRGKPRAGAAPLRRHLPRLCRPRRRRRHGARRRGQRQDAPRQRLRRRRDAAGRPGRARHASDAGAREAARAGLRGARRCRRAEARSQGARPPPRRTGAPSISRR